MWTFPLWQQYKIHREKLKCIWLHDNAKSTVRMELDSYKVSYKKGIFCFLQFFHYYVAKQKIAGQKRCKSESKIKILRRPSPNFSCSP